MVLYPGGLTISGTDVRSMRAMKSRRRSPLLWHPMPSHCASLDSCGGNTKTLCCPVGCFGRELTYGTAGNAQIDNTTVSFLFQPPLNTIKMKACTRKCLWPRGPGFPNPARSQIQPAPKSSTLVMQHLIPQPRHKLRSNLLFLRLVLLNRTWA
jgi:hypothetical protein